MTSLSEEDRLCCAYDELEEGTTKTFRAAAKAWNVPYDKLKSRWAGARPRNENGSNNTLLSETPKLALLTWINLRLTCGKGVNNYDIMRVANHIQINNGSEARATAR
ncbi:hypothetical protein B0H67DRAFT_588468 [Lasiosphaeris hirsuta]|uniref:HTH psq-type domain-containing protein n=1 Tax=Lasiosphaeris hirsuta TaxID=260670 RepID=A0AA40A1S1_9PEZI|nr:hypothetical protein B0H67DRAFT_588468 [Lasiosphaeris hirsuta]